MVPLILSHRDPPPSPSLSASRTSSNWHRHRCTDALCIRHPPARQRERRNLTPQLSRSRRRADEHVTSLTCAKPGRAQRGRAMSRCDRSQPLPPPLRRRQRPDSRQARAKPASTTHVAPKPQTGGSRNPPDWVQETTLVSATLVISLHGTIARSSQFIDCHPDTCDKCSWPMSKRISPCVAQALATPIASGDMSEPCRIPRPTSHARSSAALRTRRSRTHTSTGLPCRKPSSS